MDVTKTEYTRIGEDEVKEEQETFSHVHLGKVRVAGWATSGTASSGTAPTIDLWAFVAAAGSLSVRGRGV